MPIFVDPKTGEQFENYEPDAAERATEFGFVTKEAYDAEQRSGGLGSQIQTGLEESARQVVGLAGTVGGIASPAQAPIPVREIAPGLVSPEALERREVNPVATGIGAAVPSVVAGLALPGAGLAGLSATLGVDVASGVGQAAVDAELENRQITGTDILRNAGLNLAFSLPLYGLGEGARLALKGKAKNALETAADTARDTAGRRAMAAEGQELAQAVADPAVQADLLDRVSSNAEEAVGRAYDRIAGLSPPVVARNPNAQREAVGAIADVTRTANPDLAARLDALTKGSSKKRLAGLRELRDELASAGDSDTLAALDATIGREDLWGSKAVRGASDIDVVIGSRPGAGATPEELIDYAGKLRQVRGGEFAGMADEIEQLAERQIEIRTAATIGDVAPGAANDVVDYAAAMRTIDPNEAWRLTRDGADVGLRQIEAASTADALQRVDDVLKDDANIGVKHADFVKGAESWTPAQVAKQDVFEQSMRERAMVLAGELNTAAERGRNIKGFRASALDTIDRAVGRLASADPVARNYELDQLKRGLDSIVKRLGQAGDSVDPDSSQWAIKQILGFNDDLRKGLTDAELWGRNATLQKETNDAWFSIIDPYSRVTKKMAEFLGRDFGVVGAAGINRRFNSEMIDSVMSRGYQRELRADIDASIKGLDQMMQARQSQGLSHLDRLSKAREDLMRIRQGFDFADLLAVAKTKAKAPIGLDVVGRLANAAAPGGLVGSVVGPVASRVSDALVGDMAMLKPGSKSMLSGAVRRHIGLSRGEQAAMLADPAFFERLPASLQKQVMAGSAANDRAIQLAQTAADAAQRDRELTARLMVNPAEAKRAAKLTRKTPAIDRARARASQGGAVRIGGKESPVSLVGKSLKDLGALSDPTTLKPDTLAALRDGQGFAADFGTTGRVAQKGQAEQGIQVEIRNGQPFLVDGRHRLMVGREKGMGEVWGQIYRGRRAPGKKPIYEGPIPIGPQAKPRGGERGMVEVGDIAKSPLGVGTGAAGALGTYAALKEPAMPDPESQTPLQRFSEGYDHPSDAFRAARKMVLDWQRNPGALVDMIDGHIGDVGQQSPKLAREMTQQAMKIAAYLQDNLPGQRNVSVVYPDGTPPSRAEVRQFALRFDAAVNPAGVLADGRAGRLERTQVDTLQALWPKEYDALRAGVLEELGKGKATPQTRQRMSLLFSFPSGVDPALGARTRAIVAAARGAQDAAKKPAPSSPGMNRQRLPSTATMQPAGMAALSLGQQIGSP